MKSDHVRFSVLAADRLQPPTGHYNCHGLVFAARRANIPAAGMTSTSHNSFAPTAMNA